MHASIGLLGKGDAQELPQSQSVVSVQVDNKHAHTMGSAHRFIAWSIVVLFIVSMELKAGPVGATTAPATEVLAPESLFIYQGSALCKKQPAPVKY